MIKEELKMLNVVSEFYDETEANYEMPILTKKGKQIKVVIIEELIDGGLCYKDGEDNS
jgi:hypothetical protein